VYLTNPQTRERVCVSCGKVRDLEGYRKGKSADRLGKEQERRIERVYGPRKVGEFGDAIDLLGRDFMWQSKSTRGLMPGYLYLGQNDLLSMRPLAHVTNPIAAMCRLRSDRMPLLIRSWVRQGVPVTDVVIVRAIDWANLYGPVEGVRDYLAMTGAHFLATHGRDE
jgi:hypothetical protein